MFKRYDEVLGKEEAIHEKVPPEKEIEIVLNDPDSFEKIFDPEVEEDD